MLKKFICPFVDCELKFDGEKSKTGEFEGYASKFNGVDKYGDTIFPGAYKESLAKTLPKMFFNHDSFSIPVGDWIKAKEDEHGLYVVGKIDMEHKDGPSLYSAMKRGAVDGLSIGYRIPPGGATENDHGGYDLKAIDLKEISPVNFPADVEAKITAVKSEIETINSLKEAELYLRDSGIFSKSAACAFVSRIKALTRSDSDIVDDEITAKLQTKQAIDAFAAKLGKFNFEKG